MVVSNGPIIFITKALLYLAGWSVNYCAHLFIFMDKKLFEFWMSRDN